MSERENTRYAFQIELATVVNYFALCMYYVYVSHSTVSRYQTKRVVLNEVGITTPYIPSATSINMSFTTLNASSTANASAWSRFHERLNHAADNFYYDVGLWVATQTKLTLLMSTAVVILCSLGLMNFSTDTEGDR